jgi:polyisoprenoid-binding protein YceI
MKFSTTIIIVLFLAAIAALAIVVNSTPVNASELSDYTYLKTHTDSVRNVNMLNGMAYEYGGMRQLNARMVYLQQNTTASTVHVTMNVNGIWVR